MNELTNTYLQAKDNLIADFLRGTYLYNVISG